MANGIQKCPSGPFWPLGNLVPTPSTPMNMMSNVDPNVVNAPQSPVPGTVGGNEYTVRCNQIVIQGMKDSGTGLTDNTGNIYVIQKGSTSHGSNNRTDKGAIILTVK